MTNFIAGRDGGKTSEEGLMKPWLRLFTSGVPLSNNFNSLKVVQRAAGANMSVDVSIGDAALALTNYIYWGWSDAVNNLAVTSADPTNPRIDAVVAYVDLSVVSSASNNNPNALKFKIVDGTAAASPAVASDVAIQASVGAGNPFVKLANIAVAALASTIVNANITDVRTDISYKGTLATSSWNNLNLTPTTVTANGNRSYTMVFNGTDLTPTVSVGERIRTTRNVLAPTQCASLNGTTQYFNRTAPAGTTFTDDLVGMAWVKLNQYGTADGIISRFNGTSGWILRTLSDGRIELVGYNASGANFSDVFSNQSIPLNRWIHIAAQLDMSSFTATPTTSYVMLDGIDVSAQVTRGGTNPTALIQAGNLEFGSYNGGSGTFHGKIAQAAYFSTKITQATIQTYISQGVVGTEPNLVSAFSLSNSVTDLNTTNANNLTANGSAATTNADSPFGGQAGGAISSTLDYGIVQSISYSGNTTMVVQVPEGCAIPTSSGGIGAVSYSGLKSPYGMPIEKTKFAVEAIYLNQTPSQSLAAATWKTLLANIITAPSGKFETITEGSTSMSGGAIALDNALGIGITQNAIPEDKRQISTAWSGTTTSTGWKTPHIRISSIDNATATPYHLNTLNATVSGTGATIDTNNTAFSIRLIPEYV